MGEVETFWTRETPLWRRIANFPLVAMLIGVLVWYLGISIAGAIAILALPRIPGVSLDMKIYSFAVVILIPLYVFIIAKLGDPKRNDLRDPRWLRHLSLGLIGGTMIFSIAVLIAGVLGVYRIVAFGNLGGLLAALIAPTIGAAVTEEMLFRGILFRWIEEFGGTWVALIVSSTLFGLVHIMNPNATWFSSFAIAVEAGILLGGAYMLTRSLWFPMGLHGAWNFTQGEIFDVPVSGHPENGLVTAKLSGPALLSGGQFGLEASVIALVIATAAGVWLVVLAVRRGELVQPWWVRRRLSASLAVG
jgi:hypothetical protein